MLSYLGPAVGAGLASTLDLDLVSNIVHDKLTGHILLIKHVLPLVKEAGSSSFTIVSGINGAWMVLCPPTLHLALGHGHSSRKRGKWEGPKARMPSGLPAWQSGGCEKRTHKKPCRWFYSHSSCSAQEKLYSDLTWPWWPSATALSMA
jgi:hypothetical protein